MHFLDLGPTGEVSDTTLCLLKDRASGIHRLEKQIVAAGRGGGGFWWVEVTRVIFMVRQCLSNGSFFADLVSIDVVPKIFVIHGDYFDGVVMPYVAQTRLE